MPHASSVAVEGHEGLVAACLLLAAAYKSSQFPLTALFVRSMEGPTPTSALGYAGLSAHVGVVLLASTMPLWFPVDGEKLSSSLLNPLSPENATLITLPLGALCCCC